jgi:hypothetical protein
MGYSSFPLLLIWRKTLITELVPALRACTSVIVNPRIVSCGWMGEGYYKIRILEKRLKHV